MKEGYYGQEAGDGAEEEGVFFGEAGAGAPPAADENPNMPFVVDRHRRIVMRIVHPFLIMNNRGAGDAMLFVIVIGLVHSIVILTPNSQNINLKCLDKYVVMLNRLLIHLYQ